jgi:hypothetical protein
VVLKSAFFLFVVSLSINLFAQERVLLHIGRDGKQEAIPLGKYQCAQDVIDRLEHSKTSLITRSTSPTGLIEVIKNYPDLPTSVLTSNFGFLHQDAALQWFVPGAGGKVKEFWWRNYSQQGVIKKGTIRAWYVDPKLSTIPVTVKNKYLGAYKDPTDGDGFVTPFKPATGDQWFYGSGTSDSAYMRFDPLGTEVSTWKPGGLQVSLDSGKWQRVMLEAWGDSMFVDCGQMFGFTLSNDTKISEITDTDTRMELLSWPNTNPSPFHSLKWYETSGPARYVDKGWHLRGDYEWGMYVVIEYTTDRSPKIELQGSVLTTLLTSSRPITVKVTDDNPGGGPFGVKSVYIKSKRGALASFDSTLVLGGGSTYTGFAKSGAYSDTIYWQVVASDMSGNRTVFGPRSYVIFKRNNCRLLLYNNAQYPLGNSGANLIYTGGNSSFDRWSAVNDGTAELNELLTMYNTVLLADGSFPLRNVYPNIKTWFEKGTVAAKKNLFFTSQDYGCFINKSCTDTTFLPGTFEYDYLGIQSLGPQNLGPTNRPFKIVPVADTVTNYLIKYNKDSTTTLWYFPMYELGFASYPDGMTIKTGAKALFKDGTETNTLGVLNRGATFNSMFVAFDAGALQFRGDTSYNNGPYYTSFFDPKYQWIVDIGSLAVQFLLCMHCECVIDEIEVEKLESLITFSLEQNYPNPFNPTTVIRYRIPKSNFVKLKIFDLLGREVARLVNEEQQEGIHRVRFDAKNVASGLYFYQLQSGNFISVKKMMVLK